LVSLSGGREELEEEVIPGCLDIVRILVGRGRSDDELRGGDFVPGGSRARAHEDALGGPFEGDETAQAE
jgi:hypothetical protein